MAGRSYSPSGKSRSSTNLGPAGGATIGSGSPQSGSPKSNNTIGGGGGGGGNKTPVVKTTTVQKSKTNILTKPVNILKSAVKKASNIRYNIAKAIPGSEKSLKKNRTDYRNYLTSKGSTPDFLMDDKNLTSFETYNNLINYKPTQTNPNEKVALDYANYLADVKGNYNLKMSGNVGGMNNRDGGRDNEIINPIIKKNVGGKSILTTEKKVAADSDSESEYDSRKTKKKGRRNNVLTSAKGVTKTSSDYSLGKPTLLGMV
jgi:hypothetical protein